MEPLYQTNPGLSQSLTVYKPKDIGCWVEILTGTSIPTLQSGVEMIAHILHGAIGDNPYDPLGVYGAKYALKAGVALAARVFGDETQSRTQFKRIRDSLAQLGCFTVPERHFVRYTAAEAKERQLEGDERVRAGQMKRGANLGKKAAGRVYDIDVGRMLDIAAAMIQILKGQRTGIDGVDGWTLYKPAHGCSWLAKLWKRVKGFGTLFTPEKHEGDRPFFEPKPRDRIVDVAAIENEIYRWWDWHNYRSTKGEKPSIFAWKQLNRLRRSLRRDAEWVQDPDDGPTVIN
jgi:hypothetical protein